MEMEKIYENEKRKAENRDSLKARIFKMGILQNWESSTNMRLKMTTTTTTTTTTTMLYLL